jgi:hypothetical protein
MLDRIYYLFYLTRCLVAEQHVILPVHYYKYRRALTARRRFAE